MLQSPAYTMSRRSGSGGFALVVAMTLMALILALLLSLSALTRVEVASASIMAEHQEARNNAQMGLLAAIGKLQQMAGPDRRATANAALLDANATSTRYWTGVWDAASWDPAWNGDRTQDNAPQFLGWLVSADASNSADYTDPSAVSGAEGTVTIIGAKLQNESNRVIVPTVKVGDTGGTYAYWVSDESLKAKVNIDDPYRRAKATDNEQERARMLLPQAFALELDDRLASGSSVWKDDDWGAWGILQDLRNLPLLKSDFATVVSGDEAFAETFHNYTTEGHGLLTDARQGGLRKHLTWAILDNTAFSENLANTRLLEPSDLKAAWIGNSAKFFTPRWEVIRDYARLPLEIPELPQPGETIDMRLSTLNNKDIKNYYASNADGLANVASLLGSGAVNDTLEPTINSLTPIMTRAGYFYRLSATPSAVQDQYDIQLHIYPRITLWNPYNVPLAISSDMACVINLKSHFEIKVNNVNYYTGTLNAEVFTDSSYIRFTLNSTGLGTDNILAPGEMRVFGLQNQVSVTRGGQQQVIIPLAPYHSEDAAIVINLRGESSPTVQTGDKVSATWNRYSRFGTSAYVHLLSDTAPIQHVDSFIVSTYPFSEPGMQVETLVANPQEMGGYDIRLKNVAEPASKGVPAIANFSPRSYYTPPASSNSTQQRNWTIEIIHEPPLYQDFENMPDGSKRLRGRWGNAVDASGQPSVVLYDLPQSVPQSLAELRHANLSYYGNHAALPVGNAWAHPDLSQSLAVGRKDDYTQMDLSWLLNTALWDKYFLSSYPSGGLSGTVTQMPNSRLIAAGGGVDATALQSYDDAAAHLRIDGAFNVNSTSVRAWKALLGSLNSPNATVYDQSSGNSGSVDLEHAFTRMSRMLSGDAASNPEWFRGYWNLTETEIKALAEAIVDEVRERGPFLNLADFVNRRLAAGNTGATGALQAAIDATTVNNAFTTAYGLNAAQSAGMTGALSQADILSAVGPVLATRGDTFRIVSYGKGSNGAEIYLQAIVQRIPEYISGENAATAPASLSPQDRDFGRRFKIVRVEWLQEAPL